MYQNFSMAQTAGPCFQIENIDPIQPLIEEHGGELIHIREPNEHVPVPDNILPRFRR